MLYLRRYSIALMLLEESSVPHAVIVSSHEYTMWYILVAYLLTCTKCSHATFITGVNWLQLSPSVAGVGDVLSCEKGISIASCGIECQNTLSCTGANYFLSSHTCLLLHVEDVLDDWVEDNDVTYICVDCEPGLQGKFIA